MENQTNNQMPENNNMPADSSVSSSMARWLIWGGVFLLAAASLCFAYWQWTAVPGDFSSGNILSSQPAGSSPADADNDSSGAINKQLDDIKLEDIDAQFKDIDADLGNL